MEKLSNGRETPSELPQDQKIEWAYALSAPPEEGEPSVEFVIGVPQSSKTSAFLIPLGGEKHNLNYEIQVPLNIVVDGKTVECVAKGLLMGDLGGNEFTLVGIESKQALSDDAASVIVKTYDRILDPQSNKTVFKGLTEEIERQCRRYFEKQTTGENTKVGL